MAEVFCAYDEMVPIGDIRPNPRNPNTHPAEQIRLLARIITENGWRAPITVSTRSGYVVRGHGRLMAARHAGLSECPVDYQEYESDEQDGALEKSDAPFSCKKVLFSGSFMPWTVYNALPEGERPPR